MKITIGKIIGTLFLCLIISVLAPFIIFPIMHDCKFYDFNRSIEKIPVPIGYIKIFQKKDFGLLWANGNHVDYLVILGLTAGDNEKPEDKELYEYFHKDFSVKYPEAEKGPRFPEIYKRENGTWYFLNDGKALAGSNTGYLIDFGVKNNFIHMQRHIETIETADEKPIYYVVYTDQGDAAFDIRGH